MSANLAIFENLSEDQRIEVQAGIDKGLNVSLYANPEYMAIQMRQLRMGLEEGLDVSVYSNLEYDWFQMEEIRLGMKAGILYENYAKPDIDYRRMRQLRKGLQEGIDLSIFVKLDAGVLEQLRKAIRGKVSIVEFIKEGYVVEQLREIRKALEHKVDIRPYINKEYRGASIQEIRLGLEAGVAVDVYADTEYSWQQMRELRLGMEARVDVEQYHNPLFSWQQMRELRLGLEDGLDVSQYKKFIYTSADMEQIRKKLLLDEANDIVDTEDVSQGVDEQISVFISKDELEACIEIRGEGEITEKDILKTLKMRGVCQGILKEEIQRILTEKKYKQTIVIAKGKPAKTGKDGWYEFFFDTNPCRTPKILEDGSADFKDIKWFELVQENQKLAYYHSAEAGVAGYTVTGKFLKARRGREKNVLRGQGFRVEQDGKTYVSLMNGRVTYDGDSRLEISRVLVMGNVNLATGNVNFDGTVCVKGNVGCGVVISATENVYVDGYVEAATIKSGGEIFLRNGVNGNGSGSIEAKEGVTGQFFEEVQVIAGTDISAQYCMNCQLNAQGTINLHGVKGLLLGGYARAARGIVAHCIGNRMGLRTALSVGIDQTTINAHQKIIIDIENVNRELAILQHSKVDFQNKYTAEVRNTMDIYLKIEDAIYTKKLQLDYLRQEKEHIEEHMEDMRGARVEVTGVLYDGTEISVDTVKWKAFSVKDIVIRCVNNKIVVESK